MFLDLVVCCCFVLSTDDEETALFLVLVTGCLSVGKIKESEIFRITATSIVPLQDEQTDESIVGEVRKLLNLGTFYFSVSPADHESQDLSLCAQRRYDGTESDNRFFWYVRQTLYLSICILFKVYK